MSAKSLLSRFALGKQADMTTAATAFHAARSTESGGVPEFDENEAQPEHPGPAARSTDRKVASERTGYKVPVSQKGFLYPRSIVRFYQAMGVNFTSANNTTYHTHTGKIANDAAMLWMSALLKYSGDTDFERLIKGVRGKQFTIEAGTDGLINQTFEGVGLVEGDASGSETVTAEIATALSAYSGSLTWDIAGNSMSGTIRGANIEMTQPLEEDDKGLFSTARVDLGRSGWALKGRLIGMNADQSDYAAYRRIVRGSLVATSPSLVMPVGGLTIAFQSTGNISGAAVPFRVQYALPKVQYRIDPGSVRANGKNFVRFNVDWEMIDDSADPVVITVVNDVAGANY